MSPGNTIVGVLLEKHRWYTYYSIYNKSLTYNPRGFRRESRRTMQLTAAELAELISAEVIGDSELKISGISNLDDPVPGTVIWVEKKRYLPAAAESDAAAIIAGPEIDPPPGKTLLRVKNPRLAFALTFQLFHPPRQFAPGISPDASISPSAKLGENVTIQARAVIEDGAVIGEGSVIQGGVFIGLNSRIGRDCRIYPNVTINENIVIGDRCIIHAGAVLGGDGFGFIPDEQGNQVKVPQVGRVILEDDVEIGCNTTIDRATFGDTIIRRGVKLDNLVQIAHNDDIGENTVMAALVGISGSVKIGRNCMLAGQVGIADHAQLGDRVIMVGKSGIAAKKRVPDGQILLGAPARPLSQAKKLFALQNRLIREMEEKRGKD